MKSKLILAALVLCVCNFATAQSLEKKPSDPFFAKFEPLAAPKTHGMLLHANDRLAICGDSITEQRLYSRFMETYLTVALPELNISTRQFGWSGEQAYGFLARMTNDVLRFNPTIATTCYGMNDQHYRPYENIIGQVYQSNMSAIVDAFKSDGTLVVIGAPGCMGLNNPPWKWVLGTPEDRNLNLCQLRNIDVRLAEKDHEPFADVFWIMYQAEFDALNRWGPNYHLAGKDNVHPGQAGHLVMAYAFLKAMGIPGDIGTITVDLGQDKATASDGHTVLSCENGAVKIKSTRYPFCAAGATNDYNSVRSGMALVPFNQDLNRLILIARSGPAEKYKVAWGPVNEYQNDAVVQRYIERDYTAAELKHGINLADDFPVNPFSEAFARVDEAVAKKQAYETRQIKELFHGPSGQADMAKTVADSEQARAPLVAAVKEAFVPVEHTIIITPE